MLDIMRKSASSWWLKALLLAVALSFIIGFGILTSFRNEDQSRFAARVGKTIITHAEFQTAFENQLKAIKEKYGEDLEEEDIKKLGIRKSILDDQIDKILEIEEAKKLNIPVTDEEVRDAIKSIPYFLKDGEFDYDTYKEVLKYNKLTEAGFEAIIRNDIMIQKFSGLIKNSAKASEEDVIVIAKTFQGITPEEYNELSPDEKELLKANALMVKRIEEYNNFIKELRSKADIEYNKDYLD
ncbi:MAG: SurA N-terminal domain-containing protein [Deltaproteobacteria bacterium]|uniref:SurA N-terminal domain-containing protein n=1 Tax=Candidatus Zymogenus saltonus TaxID=2844893 RepID=A0A9D8PRC7_9DELT|nr:SurA N-terminal domain-containing protein [Candidatus Zymogenus saltonus]